MVVCWYIYRGFISHSVFFFSAWGYLVKTPELQTVGATSEFPYGGSCRQQTHVGDVRYDELVVISLCEVFVDCY